MILNELSRREVRGDAYVDVGAEGGGPQGPLVSLGDENLATVFRASVARPQRTTGKGDKVGARACVVRARGVHMGVSLAEKRGAMGEMPPGLLLYST